MCCAVRAPLVGLVRSRALEPAPSPCPTHLAQRWPTGRRDAFRRGRGSLRTKKRWTPAWSRGCCTTRRPPCALRNAGGRRSAMLSSTRAASFPGPWTATPQEAVSGERRTGGSSAGSPTAGLRGCRCSPRRLPW
eukprot:2493791-Rhodomonas_salina.3